MGTSWVRTTNTQDIGTSGFVPLVFLGAGQTLLRCRIRWGFHGTTATTANLHAIVQNIVSFGLVTVIGNGTETPPNARTQSNDQAPPTQRWTYWETRAPVVEAIDDAAGTIAWRDSGATEETSSRGQVLATGLPSGDNLDLWASWASPFAWDPTGQAVLWYGISILIKT